MRREQALENAQKIQGWMSAEELGWLWDRAQESTNALEVGSWRGRSSYALLAGLEDYPVFCVDHFNGSPSEIGDCHAPALTEDIYAQFRSNTREFANRIVFRMDSVEAAACFQDRSIDMIFIDGEHTLEAVRRDVEAWLPKCRKLFCGHDRIMQGVSQYLVTRPEHVQHGPGSIWWWRVDK